MTQSPEELMYARWSPATPTRAPRVWIALLALLAACPGSDKSIGPSPSIVLTVSPSSLTLTQGQNGTVQVSVTRTNFSDPVALSVTGTPGGATATFSPTSLTGATQ